MGSVTPRGSGAATGSLRVHLPVGVPVARPSPRHRHKFSRFRCEGGTYTAGERRSPVGERKARAAGHPGAEREGLCVEDCGRMPEMATHHRVGAGWGRELQGRTESTRGGEPPQSSPHNQRRGCGELANGAAVMPCPPGADERPRSFGRQVAAAVLTLAPRLAERQPRAAAGGRPGDGGDHTTLRHTLTSRPAPSTYRARAAR